MESPGTGHTVCGDVSMKNGRQMLLSILKSARTGQAGIRSVLDMGSDPALRRALECQLREFDCIESETYAIASQRGWELRESDPILGFLSDRFTRMKLSRGNCDSKIADIMIQASTRGMIRGLKSLHQYPHQDDRIAIICQKLLDFETSNILTMQTFL